jgi:hypothetical protein
MKRFHGSEAVHRRELADETPALRDAISEAIASYREGDCLRAGQEIDQAWRLLGRLEAHNLSLPFEEGLDSTRIKFLYDSLRNVDSKFERTCVRKKPTRR